MKIPREQRSKDKKDGSFILPLLIPAVKFAQWENELESNPIELESKNLTRVGKISEGLILSIRFFDLGRITNL